MCNLLRIEVHHGLAPHTASNWLGSTARPIRELAELLMEEDDYFLGYGVVEYGNLITDDGMVVASADTIICGELSPLSELVATAENDCGEYPFAQATYWRRDNPGDEGTTYILYFA